MAPLKFYMAEGSCVCRAVWMIAKALNLDLEIIRINLAKMEQLKPDFVKVNPMHTVPTINDDGFILWESRAIMAYLSDKYGADDALYPRDVQKRAVVDRFLYFDLGVVYKCIAAWEYPLIIPAWREPAGSEAHVKTALGQLNDFLAESNYVSGDTLTIADLALLSSVTLLEIVDYDITPWTNVAAWVERCKQLPYYQECNRGLDMMKEMRKRMQKPS